LLPLVLAGAIVSCGSQEQELFSVRQFHLRDIELADNDAQMVRGEQLYRLGGAVTMEERRSRLGHYYTVYWNLPQADAGEVKIVFEYQQAVSASKVLTMTRKVPAGQATGSVEFNITGKAYQEGGNVLAWRAKLMRGGMVLATKRSYLWR